MGSPLYHRSALLPSGTLFAFFWRVLGSPLQATKPKTDALDVFFPMATGHLMWITDATAKQRMTQLPSFSKKGTLIKLSRWFSWNQVCDEVMVKRPLGTAVSSIPRPSALRRGSARPGASPWAAAGSTSPRLWPARGEGSVSSPYVFCVVCFAFSGVPVVFH